MLQNIQEPTSSESLITISGTENKYITFEYTSGAENTSYTTDFPEDIECYILIVGGGGGGGGGDNSADDGVSGGWGGGGLVCIPNITCNGTYNINFGSGGRGSEVSGVNGNFSKVKKTDGTVVKMELTILQQ